MKFSLFLFSILLASHTLGHEANTLPAIENDVVPQDIVQMWAGFDPRAEPLETEIIREWEEDGVVLRIVRFRIGRFKGQTSRLAGIYGFPKLHKDGQSKDAGNRSHRKLPGLLQIHGGGQYADSRACVMNAKRGYATLSIAWAGRISAPNYRVGPEEVKLFWQDKTDDPDYKRTTDWGALDGYHAPCRHPSSSFPSAKPAAWTIDSMESPRNSPWFLCALAARRGLTFLEQQPEVDASKLGVYGHSMGGKLTVMTSVDSRVKAAAPSCGGISDRSNSSKLFQRTIGDDANLREVACPILFLSPANDFHGRIGDLPRAINEIQTDEWRVTCSPHGSHQDNAEFEVATLLWFDEHLKGTFTFPKTPITHLQLESESGIPSLTIQPDKSRQILSIDVYYTQHGKDAELPTDRENTKSRFWRHGNAVNTNGIWTAHLPLLTTERPLWVYANVTYPLDPPVSGAGYYYREYTARTMNVSSLLRKASSDQLVAAGVQATLKPSLVIETFDAGWQAEWFTYAPEKWPRATHKIYDPQWQPPSNAQLVFQVRCEQPNDLVVKVDEHAAVVHIDEAERWQDVILARSDFLDFSGNSLTSWENLHELKLSDKVRLKPPRSVTTRPRSIGGEWRGPAPQFRHLAWFEVSPSSYLAPLVANCKVEWPNNRIINIVCHGHSVPAGYFKTPVVDSLNAYPHLLHTELKKRFPLAVINVIVTAEGGEDSVGGASRFANSVLPHQPDLVLIDYGLNDRRAGLEESRIAWQSMIAACRKNGVPVILLTPTADKRANLFSDDDPLSKHAAQIRELAEHNGVGLADSYSAIRTFLRKDGNLDSIMSQVNHPNRTGHEMVVTELLRWFDGPNAR